MRAPSGYTFVRISIITDRMHPNPGYHAEGFAFFI